MRTMHAYIERYTDTSPAWKGRAVPQRLHSLLFFFWGEFGGGEVSAVSMGERARVCVVLLTYVYENAKKYMFTCYTYTCTIVYVRYI